MFTLPDMAIEQMVHTTCWTGQL